MPFRFATHSANTLLLLLTTLIVFYVGEAMHRDRELKIEPVIWSTPITNSVLLLSKCLAMVLLALVLVLVAGLITILAQLFKGHRLDLTSHVLVYGLILVPGLIFVTAFVIALNGVLRNKYVPSVVATATGALFAGHQARRPGSCSEVEVAFHDQDREDVLPGRDRFLQVQPGWKD